MFRNSRAAICPMWLLEGDSLYLSPSYRRGLKDQCRLQWRRRQDCSTTIRMHVDPPSRYCIRYCILYYCDTCLRLFCTIFIFIQILCGLVNGWFHDVSHNCSVHADLLLMHFYRWLRSSISSLYDPALHRFIHKLMKKVCEPLCVQALHFAIYLFAYRMSSFYSDFYAVVSRI